MGVLLASAPFPAMRRHDDNCLWKGAMVGDPIYFIKFEHTFKITIHFPFALHQISLFSLVVVVFLLQGVPGMVLTCCKKYMAAAFKLNEFNFLLGMLELDSKAMENELE